MTCLACYNVTGAGGLGGRSEQLERKVRAPTGRVLGNAQAG